MTTPARYDVVALGNAIVDVIAPVEDAFLAGHGVAKGAMTLIDEARAAALYAAMPPAREVSGGSAANTAAGVASLGGRAAYLGKVAADQLGEVFAHDIRAAGVDFATAPLKGGPATARCLILVTPDAQRSMSTFLGASSLIASADVDASTIEAAQILYLEGYLFDREEAKRAFIRAAEIAKSAGRRVALTLSDPFCVHRHRASFRQLVAHHVDILFANEAEIVALYEAAGFNDALAAVRQDCALAFLTRSEKGSVVVQGAAAHEVPAAPVDPAVVDTTGAGDLYAAGALFGLAHGRSPIDCGRLGSLAAAEAISHYGARPETSLHSLAAEAGLL